MDKKQTAREYCASKRSVPFGGYRLTQGKPHWRKLSGGYIGVVDGSKQAYVAPGHIFAVEVHGGEAGIYSYSRSDLNGLAGLKPYAIGSLYHSLSKREKWTKKAVSYEDMIKVITRMYNDIYIPSECEFWAEYGFGYDNRTGTIRNIVGIVNDTTRGEK